ncbi:MAG: hypothetical protein AWU55_1426 [Halomonadaceae bacterium T82-2]|nr:MAG: hypothetical protein AWU55_1426 [Halomonadaceae bacterium T82-2]
MARDPVADTPQTPDTTMPLVVYILLLAGFVVGITPLIGVVIAYIYRGKGPEWKDAHYRYQIRTFWVGLLYSLGAVALSLIGIGLLAMIALAAWLIVRCVKGMMALQERRAPDRVASWLW